MGYNSMMEGNPVIQIKKIADFKKAVEELKKEKGKLSEDICDYFFDEYELDEKTGKIEYSDYYQKWYETDMWAVFMCPFMKGGTEITFVGEDGEKWGYHWKNGNVYHLRFIQEVDKTPNKRRCLKCKAELKPNEAYKCLNNPKCLMRAVAETI